MPTPNQEQVLAKAQEAMLALDGLKEFQTKTEAKLDAIDVDKQIKLFESITSGIEESQKLRQTVEAEVKSRAELAKDLESQVKTMHDAGLKDFETRFGTIEATMDRISLRGGEQDEVKSLEKKWSKAFNAFAAVENPNKVYFSDYVATNAELKDLTVGSDVDGGFMVTPTLGAMVSRVVRETSPMRSIASEITINSDMYEYLLDDGEAESGGWVGEVQARPTTGTPPMQKQRIPVHEQYANPKMSQKFLDDAGFDAEGWLQGKVADILTRVENAAFVLGDDPVCPKGFLKYPNVDVAGKYQFGAVEQVTSGASATFGYDDLIALTAALEPRYDINARWVMNRMSLGRMLVIKDANSTPIFNMDYSRTAGALGAVLGKEITFAADMPKPISNALAIAYGDFRKGYLIIDRIGIRVLRDPFTIKPFIQFYTTKRVGGDVVDFGAIKILKLAA